MRPDYITGPYIQSGKGFGSLFVKAFAKVIPVVKSFASKLLGLPITKQLATTAKNAALTQGGNFVADVLEGKNVKDSGNKAFTGVKKAFAKDIRNASNATNSEVVPVKARKRKKPHNHKVKKIKKIKKMKKKSQKSTTLFD